MIRDIFRLGALLLLICAVAGAALGWTYASTRTRIAEQQALAQNRLYREVLPQAVNFSEKTIADRKYQQGTAADGSTAGYVAMTAAEGYGGDVELIIGLQGSADDAHVAGVRVLRHTETPGLGAKVAEPDFYKQYDGLREEAIALNKDTAAGKIDAVTAATISSRAVTDAVRQVLKEYKAGMQEAGR